MGVVDDVAVAPSLGQRVELFRYRATQNMAVGESGSGPVLAQTFFWAAGLVGDCPAIHAFQLMSLLPLVLFPGWP
jgi:hypothetical protein